MYKENLKNQIIIYQSKDGLTKVDVQMSGDTIWVSQAQIAKLFGVTAQNITIHLKNIFSEGELDENRTCKEFLQVQKVKTLSPVEKDYLDSIKSLGKKVVKKVKSKPTKSKRTAIDEVVGDIEK